MVPEETGGPPLANHMRRPQPGHGGDEEPVADDPLPELGVAVHLPEEADLGELEPALLRNLPQAGFGRFALFQGAAEQGPDSAGGNPGDVVPELLLLDLLKQDPKVTRALPKKDLDALFDLAYHLKHVDTIFKRCPALYGFAVQDCSALPEELRSLALERELVVTDIGVYPYLNADQCEQIYNEIAVALLDFMFERPAAKDLLRGRTFARTLH